MIEHSIIGALLKDETAYDRVSDRLHADLFTNPSCLAAYQALEALAQAGRPFDTVSVLQWLDDRGRWEADLAQEIGDMARNAVARNITGHLDMLEEQNTRRRLQQMANLVAEQLESGQDVEQIRQEAEQMLMTADKGGEAKGVRDILTKVVDDLDARFNNGGQIVGLPTGFHDLDQLTSGLQAPDLIVLAARPSMGKTTLAMNIAEHVSESLPVLVFSLEMSSDQLVSRSIASLGRVNFNSIRTGQVEDEEWPRITNGTGLLSERKLFIDDTSGVSLTAIRSRARRFKRKHGLGLVVVDYLQLMQGPGENRTQVIGNISRGLKSIAKELQVPVIALSQLNRSLEKRPNKRPVMSDLRESGDIEQDADIVMFIYRDEVYDEDSPDKGMAEVHIAKQRQGPIGTRRLSFLGHFCRFEDFAFRDAWAPPVDA